MGGKKVCRNTAKLKKEMDRRIPKKRRMDIKRKKTILQEIFTYKSKLY